MFNARSRLGRTVFETELARLGIAYKHSRPYHPQTCGKIERWHQTLKQWLAHQPAARTIPQLQAQLDRFVHLYNEERPHRARQRRTPRQAFDARTKARPGSAIAAPHFRVRTDRVDQSGKISLRHDSKMFHIGIGRRYAGQAMRLYIAGLNIRVVTLDGELIRQLELDPTRLYQPQQPAEH